MVSTELLELVGCEIEHYHVLVVVTTSHPVGVDKQLLCPREFLFDRVLALLPPAHNVSRPKRLCARVCPQVGDRLPGLMIDARLGRLCIEKYICSRPDGVPEKGVKARAACSLKGLNPCRLQGECIWSHARAA